MMGMVLGFRARMKTNICSWVVGSKDIQSVLWVGLKNISVY